MATKLYPPVIAGTIPAFSGTTLVVPYAMNRAVGSGDFNGLVVKVKTISGILVDTYSTDNFLNQKAIFNIDKEKFRVGQYYKVQLAYSANDENNTIGYYSSVGVVKYTSEPEVFIEGLDKNSINTHMYNYIGVYRQNDDTSEKMYSSRFILCDSAGEIVLSSDEIIHNTNEDTSRNEAIESFLISNDLEENKNYNIVFEVITNNGMMVRSPQYLLRQRQTIKSTLEASLEAKLDYERGVVELFLISDMTIASGNFLISRASDKDNYTWEKIQYFSLDNENPNKMLFTDYMVEQGINYKYSVQQYNSQNFYSKRIISNDIKVDFEDLFLYDGKRQLKIKFNPKVSTYKTDIVENKTDTIGSKYPFITRNGHVNYKEFNISGLISYQMDDMETFYTLAELGFAPSELIDTLRDEDEDHAIFDYEFPSTGLTTQNFKAERIFKNLVNDWLTNGEPKVYRSPSEGNFIVRIMNVNLSPVDTVSRMLHSFNCVAYEIADFKHSVLEEYGMIRLEQKSAEYQYVSQVIDLSQIGDGIDGVAQINSSPAYSVSFWDLPFGTEFFIGETKETAKSFYIGITGAYDAEFTKPMGYIGINTTQPHSQGQFAYGYYSKTRKEDFDSITEIEFSTIADRQFIGYNNELEPGENVIEYLQDIKTQITKVDYTNFVARDVIPVYITSDSIKEGMRFWDYDVETQAGQPGALSDIKIYADEGIAKLCDIRKEPWAIYKIYIKAQLFKRYTNLIYDPIEDIVRKDDGKIFEVLINDEAVDLEEIYEYHLSELDEYNSIVINPGVILDMGYQIQMVNYKQESENENIVQKKKLWLEAIADYESYYSTLNNEYDNVIAHYKLFDIKVAYNNFVKELEVALNAKKEDKA